MSGLQPARKVTVGMPVYNGAVTIAQALNSLLAQDFGDFTVIIFDNASTDGTLEICRRFAALDPRISVRKHDATVAVMDNYRHALMAADTEYFMWLAADDVIAPQFISRNLAFLEDNAGYVSSQSKVLFHHNHVPARLARGTFALRGSPQRNLSDFLHKPQDNCRFYGLFRTKALQSSFPEGYFLGLDWAIMSLTLLHGKHNEIGDVLMLRDATPPEKYQHDHDRENGSWLDRTLPLNRFSRFLLSNHPFASRPVPLARLLSLNWQMTRNYVGYRAYQQAQSRLARRSAASPAGWLERIVMRFTNPDPGPSAADQLHAARRWLKSLGSKAAAAPAPIRFRDESWKALPDAGPNGPDVTIAVVVKDALEQTLRLMHAIGEAAQPLKYQLLVLDAHSLDATGLLFAARRDIAYVRISDAPATAEVLTAIATHARSDRLIIVDQKACLHEASLRAMAECIAAGGACSGKYAIASAPATAAGQSSEWIGAVALHSEMLGKHAPVALEPFSFSALASALGRGSGAKQKALACGAFISPQPG